ncbi:reactivating factor for D-ornithine aminomutase [Cutibacterium acnes JCM 18909]|nr:reactivating factor for D-ornithine aminomutase [Cutibacterium acnes JCM 18909]
MLTTLEIGSTITKANAFRMESGLLHHIGQGFAPTSVAAGDVRIGADAAIARCVSNAPHLRPPGRSS